MDHDTVGVRDLKARLSEHLRRVKAGGTVLVTEHGRPIGRIVPIEPDVAGRLRVLADAGVVLWNGDRLPPAPPAPPVRRGGSVADLLIEDRG